MIEYSNLIKQDSDTLQEREDLLCEQLDNLYVKRFVVASVPDIYREIEGPFQKWYRNNTGIMWTSSHRKGIDKIEASDLDYIILRITWHYMAL